MFEKLVKIMWHERHSTPFRVIEKSYARFKKHGYQGMLERLEREYYRLYPTGGLKIDSKKEYVQWMKKYEANEEERERFNYEPLLSIITPTFNSNVTYLVAMLDSVLAQTYSNWELCIADDASTDVEVKKILASYVQKHPNIHVTYREKNGHICEASNSALALASGEYLLFLDHDDTLSANALYEMVKKLNEQPNLKLIYSDEDKIDEMGARFSPHFKPDWNPELFFSQNYVCHLVMISHDVVRQIGGFKSGFEGSQDYELLLRAIEHLESSEIGHVQKVLYHWRAVVGSTAYGSSEKSYAHDAGKKALQEYFKSVDAAITVEDGLLVNTYKVNYPSTNEALVSIIIPTRDMLELLQKCVQSILENTAYSAYEILIVDNDSQHAQTTAYLNALEHSHCNVRVLHYPFAFNFSAINNFAASHAKGEYLAFLNNDVEVISSNWLSEMLSHAQRSGVGAVGAKLYYDNGAIQHGGVLLGVGGVAGHAHKYFEKNADGYFSRLKVVQNYSAVTAACMVVKKERFMEVNGFNEEHLAIAFNDVDLCLKLLSRGYRNVWTPYAELFHHESISRGAEDTPEKIARFNKETIYMKEHWGRVLKEDAMYNFNLTLKHENFNVKA